MESLNFNGIINGFISDKELTGYTTIENVREMIVCVSKNIFKNDKFNSIDEVLEISDLLNKNIYDLNDFECFKIVLASILIRSVDIIVCKNCFCNLDYKLRKEVKLLFTKLRRLKWCRFIIISKDVEILADICDYIVTDSVSGKIPDVYKKIDDIPFTVRFSNRVKDLKNIDIGYRTEIEDLMKDVYRYVR